MGREADDKGLDEEIPVQQRLAITMVALGEEASGQVMKYLSDFEIEEITQAIVDTKNVTPQIMDLVLEDFEQHLLAGHYIS